jgi:hypothetical protein
LIDAPADKHLWAESYERDSQTLEKVMHGAKPPADGVDETDEIEAGGVLFNDSLFRALVVQRSRAYVRASQEQSKGSALYAIFPEREAPRVLDYSIKKTYGKVLYMVEAAFSKDKPLFSLAMYHPLEMKDGSNVFPLWLYPEENGLTLSNERQLNLSPVVLERWASLLGLPSESPVGLPKGLTAEDVLNYVYAVFHTPTYRSRYAEFLRIDFPRLPFLNQQLGIGPFTFSVRGRIALHLIKSAKLDRSSTKLIGGTPPEVERVSYRSNTAWLDKNQTSGFKGAPGRLESPYRWLPGLRKMAQGWQGPPAPEGGDRALPTHRRRARRDSTRNEGYR